MKDAAHAMRTRVAKFLRAATNVVMHSYWRYLKADQKATEEDIIKKPAEFKAFHDAGKSAAAHLKALMDLAKDAEEKPEDQDDSENLKHKIASAEEKIRNRE